MPEFIKASEQNLNAVFSDEYLFEYRCTSVRMHGPQKRLMTYSTICLVLWIEMLNPRTSSAALFLSSTREIPIVQL